MADETQTPQTTTIVAEQVTGTLITFAYSTPAGNRPAANGDTVFLWEMAAPAVPVGTPPLYARKMTGNTPRGTGVLTDVQITTQAYLLAYAVGPAVGNVAAFSWIPPLGAGGGNTSFQPVVTAACLTARDVAYQYTMPAGTLPASEGDWVGIWETADTSLLFTAPPLAWSPVATNSSTGQGLLSATTTPGTLCTLGYFKGGYAGSSPAQTTLACTTTVQA